jgi:hypothetical protein
MFLIFLVYHYACAGMIVAFRSHDDPNMVYVLAYGHVFQYSIINASRTNKDFIQSPVVVYLQDAAADLISMNAILVTSPRQNQLDRVLHDYVKWVENNWWPLYMPTWSRDECKKWLGACYPNTSENSMNWASKPRDGLRFNICCSPREWLFTSTGPGPSLTHWRVFRAASTGH